MLLQLSFRRKIFGIAITYYMINMYCLTISPILSSIPRYTAHISKFCIVGVWNLYKGNFVKQSFITTKGGSDSAKLHRGLQRSDKFFLGLSNPNYKTCLS